MNKKNKSFIIILIIILGVILLTIGIICIAKNNKSSNSSNNKKLTKITSLLKNDYLVSNYVFGKPNTDEANVIIDDTKYNIIVDKDVTSINDLNNLINNTYTGDILTTYLIKLNEYNKYVETENKLYVNINSKCNIDKFDDKISIVSETDDTVTVKTNNRTVKVSKDGNIYKLKESAYNCK
jgi:hypothetical protein